MEAATEAAQRARATWSAGDYDAIVDHIWSAGADVVARAGVSEGDRVLDVACGTGNAAIPAAAAGGQVVGLDITPELFEDARRRAANAGVELELVEGNAEDLPFDEESFDLVVSTFGCMFAPRHQVAAAEIARVVKPGGRIGIAAWTPDGAIGRFFRAMSELAPPPPPDFQPPPLWGTRDHVESLFAETGLDLRFEEGAVNFEFESVDAALDEYWDSFGPIVMLRRALEPQGREAELRQAVRGSFEEHARAGETGLAYPGEYLITLGEKSG